jgi:uncharacterized damage-inducible protein DinB
MRTILLPTALCLLAAGAASAQTADPNPYTRAVQAQFKQIHGIVVRSAEKIGADLYTFKPTPEVRSIGEIFAHIADAEAAICSLAKGDKPGFGTHDKKTTKAEVLEVLKLAATHCDGVFATMTDQAGTAAISMFGQTTPKLMVLGFNNNHTWEHYGNLVTYMRLKGIVPPTSERGMM